MPFKKGHKINVGNNWNKGKAVSGEIRSKISASSKGKKFSKSVIRKINQTKRKIRAVKISKIGDRYCKYCNNKLVSRENEYPCAFFTRKYCDTRCRDAVTGDKSPNYKGGINKINKLIRGCDKYTLWRMSVFVRDNFACARCSSVGYIHAHHIIRLSSIIIRNHIKDLTNAFACDEIWSVENGETLCISCHKDEHSEEQYANQ
jgi:hypothetical protein